ncbi:hypothetical protein [uncultured Gimesia sp.]|uniref:hypothetical protein n=1 Tax=uncultured Gimesia sp. TaxID=1678688 RepID=UPI002610FA27|nr:hypothetical protein [uncultured Gimesia sp.]
MQYVIQKCGMWERSIPPGVLCLLKKVRSFTAKTSLAFKTGMARALKLANANLKEMYH